MFWKLVDMIADLFDYVYSNYSTNRRMRGRVLGGLFAIPLFFIVFLILLVRGDFFPALMIAMLLGPFVIYSLPEIFGIQYPKVFKCCLWGVYVLLGILFFSWIAVAMR